MATQELTFQRASVHLEYDAKRLEDGKDLNDALLDFFVKLGQALIPEEGGNGAPPSVAYLGSHFYDVLRKGGVEDGRAGHKNVANWARRRLGRDGLFSDGVGALAVPVNEVLRDSYEGKQDTQEKHWWLALLLNPRAASGRHEGEDTSLLCLDSFVRADTHYDPPIRAVNGGGSNEAYSVEVSSVSRVGFEAIATFQAVGDGTAGPLAEPRRSRLQTGGREFTNPELRLTARDLGGDGRPGKLRGALRFRLDRRGAAKTGGEYTLRYEGAPGDDYQPHLRLRMGQKPTSFQAQVANFLGGYLAKEQETAAPGAGAAGGALQEKGERQRGTGLEAAICLPGIPQQETSHDCGFFILEQILRALQLPARALRELATASAVEIAMLPWPSQKQVLRRKAMLREAVGELFATARREQCADVEALFQADAGLRGRIRAALREGCPSFSKGFERWEVGDWDLSPSASRSGSRSRWRSGASNRGGSTSDSRPRGRRRRRGAKHKRSSSTSSSSSSRGGKRKRRRRSRRRSSTRSSSRASTRSRSRGGGKPAASQPPPKPQPSVAQDDERPRPQASFTQDDLRTMSVAALREACIQHLVLPAGIVERADLVGALAPLAAPPPAASPPMRPQAAPAAAVPQAKALTREELEAMTSKALRTLCIERGVLPCGLVERGDLLQALAPR